MRVGGKAYVVARQMIGKAGKQHSLLVARVQRSAKPSLRSGDAAGATKVIGDQHYKLRVNAKGTRYWAKVAAPKAAAAPKAKAAPKRKKATPPAPRSFRARQRSARARNLLRRGVARRKAVVARRRSAAAKRRASAIRKLGGRFGGAVGRKAKALRSRQKALSQVVVDDFKQVAAVIKARNLQPGRRILANGKRYVVAVRAGLNNKAVRYAAKVPKTPRAKPAAAAKLPSPPRGPVFRSRFSSPSAGVSVSRSGPRSSRRRARVVDGMIESPASGRRRGRLVQRGAHGIRRYRTVSAPSWEGRFSRLGKVGERLQRFVARARQQLRSDLKHVPASERDGYLKQMNDEAYAVNKLMQNPEFHEPYQRHHIPRADRSARLASAERRARSAVPRIKALLKEAKRAAKVQREFSKVLGAKLPSAPRRTRKSGSRKSGSRKSRSRKSGGSRKSGSAALRSRLARLAAFGKAQQAASKRNQGIAALKDIAVSPSCISFVLKAECRKKICGAGRGGGGGGKKASPRKRRSIRSEPGSHAGGTRSRSRSSRSRSRSRHSRTPPGSAMAAL